MRRMFGFLIGFLSAVWSALSLPCCLPLNRVNTCATELRDRGQNFLNDVRHSADARRIELRGPARRPARTRDEF
jgi:hypothetical protein